MQATQFARDLAHEHRLNLADIEGIGVGGQILKKDVGAHLDVQGGAGDRDENRAGNRAGSKPAPTRGTGK